MPHLSDYEVVPLYDPKTQGRSSAPAVADLVEYGYDFVEMMFPGYGPSLVASAAMMLHSTYGSRTQPKDKGDNSYRVYSLLPKFRRLKYFRNK